jgi:hypothetical protein
LGIQEIGFHFKRTRSERFNPALFHPEGNAVELVVAGLETAQVHERSLARPTGLSLAIIRQRPVEQFGNVGDPPVVFLDLDGALDDGLVLCLSGACLDVEVVERRPSGAVPQA